MYLVIFKRDGGFGLPLYSVSDMCGNTGVVEFAIGGGQAAVVGEGDGVVVAQVDSEFSGESGEFVYGGKGAISVGSLHGEVGAEYAIGEVDVSDNECAIVTGEAEFGAATGLADGGGSVKGVGAVFGVDGGGEVAIP